MIGLLALSSALAAPCAGAWPVATVPAPEATGVPVDVVLAAALWADCGPIPPAWRMQLLLDGAVVHDEVVAFSGDTHLESRLAAPLDANTRYELHVLPDDGGGSEVVAAFTTGDAVALALSGPPVASDVSGTYWAESDTLAVDATVDPVDDPQSLVGLALEPGGPAFVTRDAAITTLSGSIEGASDENTVCVVPVQWGADGVRVEGAEACGPVDEVRTGGLRCDTTASPAAAWPLALLLLTRRRAWSSSSR